MSSDEDDWEDDGDWDGGFPDTPSRRVNGAEEDDAEPDTLAARMRDVFGTPPSEPSRSGQRQEETPPKKTKEVDRWVCCNCGDDECPYGYSETFTVDDEGNEVET